MLRTPAWAAEVDAATRDAFEGELERLRKQDVVLIERSDDAEFAALEDAFFGAFVERSIDVTSYEIKWPYEHYAASRPELLEKRLHERLARAREMRPAYYAELLAGKAQMQARARQVLGEADAVITLSASGPAPVGHSHTGSRNYQLFATFLGLPAFSLPLMEADGMPVGVQLIGHAGRDGELCAHAHWMASPGA